jgi:predicted adenylyl cyclase CyaB
MARNVEIKAKIRDSASLRQRAELLSDGPAEVIPQLDTFFTVRSGRLKLRERASGAAQLIFYERPDSVEPRVSEYHIFETQDPDRLKSVLGLALGIRGIVEKVRHLYMIGQTRLHLDEVKGLGDYMELEVLLHAGQSEQEGRAIAEDLVDKLRIEGSDLVRKAYIDLLEKAD